MDLSQLLRFLFVAAYVTMIANEQLNTSAMTSQPDQDTVHIED